MSAEKREEVTREVFRLFDEDRNGVIEREEWMRLSEKGVRLPDFGVGSGFSMLVRSQSLGVRWMEEVLGQRSGGTIMEWTLTQGRDLEFGPEANLCDRSSGLATTATMNTNMRFTTLRNSTAKVSYPPSFAPSFPNLESKRASANSHELPRCQGRGFDAPGGYCPLCQARPRG